MSFNPNMSNKEVADLIFLNYKDQSHFMDLDYANVTTTGLEATREYATGGQGAPQRIVFDGQRKGTLKIESQIGTMKFFSMIAGSDIANTFKYVKKYTLTAAQADTTPTLTIPDGDAVVTGTVEVYKDGSDSKAEVTVTGNAITGSGLTAGDKYTVYAMINVSNAQTVKFNSSNFPKAYTIYGETPWKTEDEEIVAMHLAYYKAVPQSQFELAFSNTGIISLSITCDLLANGDGDIYDMAVVE